MADWTGFLSAMTLVLVRGVTTVEPVLLNGAGWDTSRVEATLMVMLPPPD